MKIMRKVVLTGLEGCSKSTKKFQDAIQRATREKPVLFGVKNYKLMAEQRDNWSNRFNIPKEEFAICGYNTTYDVAMESYTTPKTPFLIPDSARVVFTSQALIQRNKHLNFVNISTGEVVEYSEIVIDEFDFMSGIIPSLDYQLQNCYIEREKIESILLDWVQKSYSSQDFNRVAYASYKHNKAFTTAWWIESCPVPLTFLTSESLAVEILMLLGFEKEVVKDEVKEASFKDCTINYFSHNNITVEFIKEMSKTFSWNYLDYDLIISDIIKGYFTENNCEDRLKVEVISHSGVRGSNTYRDKNILTILTHIPDLVVKVILEFLQSKGSLLSFQEVKTLFYRDRLCQAVGRTLGYRGGTTTDLVIHSSLLDTLKNDITIPYSMESKEILNAVPYLDDILEKISNVRLENNQKIAEKLAKKTGDFDILSYYFKKDETKWLSIFEVKDFLVSKKVLGKSGKVMTATSVANHFGLKIVTRKVDGKSVRLIKGLNFKL